MTLFIKNYYKVFFLLLLAFWCGYEAHKKKIFPLKRFIEKKISPSSKNSDATISNESISIPPMQKINFFNKLEDKNKITCPKKEDAFVIIGFGQSNSANHAGHRFKAKNKKILNFFEGNCYEAQDPLLGATGHQGSLWIPLAEKIKTEKKTIVLATFGVGGTFVKQWLEDDTLINFYDYNLKNLIRIYPKPDIAFWIQGENEINSNIKDLTYYYKKHYSGFLKSLPYTKLFVTGTSYCDGKENKMVLKVQESTSKSTGAIYAGSTDTISRIEHRYDDCHFSQVGIEELTKMLSNLYNERFLP